MKEFSREKLYEFRKIANFKELISSSNNLYGDKIAFKYKLTPKDDSPVCITYSDFNSDICSLGTSLLKLDLPIKRIAIISPNRYEWCVSYLAITIGGMVVVPLDKSLPNNEIESSIIRSGADCVIFDKKYSEIFSKIRNDKSSNLKYFICMDSSENPYNFLSYSKLLLDGKNSISEGNNSFSNVEIDNNKMSIMLFTSGTTSISKIVKLSQANICANLYSIGCIAKVTSKDTFLSFLPLHHTFESTTTFLYGLSCGITIAFCDGLRYISKNLKEYEVTGLVCVPLMLEAMYKKIQKGIAESKKDKLVQFMTIISNSLLKIGIDLRRVFFKSILEKLGGKLRVIVYGAAPMDPNTIRGLTNIGINMLQGYGLTETSPVIAAENDKYKRPGSIGFPLPTVEIKIESPDENGIGEILAKGPNIMLGYYKNDEETNKVLKDGWFNTGDLGYFDNDGYLFISGRKKNVIVLKNGKNIFPEELEILVSALPFVAENIVYGKPEPNGDLKLCVKIVYKPEVMKEMFKDTPKDKYHEVIWKEIKNINKTMPTYKHIRELIVTDEELIKTTTQKVKRQEEIKRILNQDK